MNDLTDLTVTQSLRLLEEKKVSSTELTEACINRIDTLEPHLHAFITRTTEMASAQAKSADDMRAKSNDPSSTKGLSVGWREASRLRSCLALRI